MSKITVARVYWVTEGSALLEDVTSGSPATGGRLKVEAVTDFPVPFDGETRTALVDDEEITYTDTDEDTEELVDITRAANSTVAVAHTAGTFVQYGTEAKREKFADGFIDDDDALSEGVEIARHLWRFYPVGQRDHEEMEVSTVHYLSDDHPIIIDAPDDGDNPLTPFPFIWSIIGTLSLGVRPHNLGAPFSGTIEEFYATLTEVADDDVIIDLLVEGVSVLDGSMLVIPAGQTTSSPVPIVPVSKALTKYQGLEIEVVQIGSSSDPGRYATIWALLYPNENSAGGRIEVPGPQGDPGTNGANGLITEVQDEGTPVTDAPVLDFTGDGVGVTSDGSVITVNVPASDGTSVGARAYRATTSQSISNITATAIQLNAEDYDTSGFHDNATNNTRFTIPTGLGGRIFSLKGTIRYASNATGERQIRFLKNGTTRVELVVSPPMTGGVITSLNASADVMLADGDYVEMQAYQASGGSLAVDIDDTHFEIKG